MKNNRTLFQFIFLGLTWFGLCFFLFSGIWQLDKGIKALDGAYTDAGSVKFSLKDWMAGLYQEQTEKNLEQRVGFRPSLIRLRNQLDFSLFREVHSENVFVGGDDYLFRSSGLDEMNGAYSLKDSEWLFRLSQLHALENYLRSNNTPLILVIAPSKEYCCKEFIPARRLRKGAKSQYDRFRREITRGGFHLLDLNAAFTEMQKDPKFPLFCRTGIHWTEYGAILGMDTILRYAENLKGTKYPRLHWNKLLLTEQPSEKDGDILRSVNLIRPIPSGTLAYPVLLDEYPPDVRRPDMLVIGDSYYHAISYTNVHRYISQPRSAFWYYCKDIWSVSSDHTEQVADKNLLEELQGRDFVMMIFTPTNLCWKFWDFPRIFSEELDKK